MVVVQLTGGLGNQLFQYSIGRYLSLLSKDLLVLDTTSYSWDGLRRLELTNFNIQASLQDNMIQLFQKKKPNLLDRFNFNLLKKDISYYRLPILQEQSFVFDRNFKKFRNKDVYLKGYWQSEKYFINIRQQLLIDLKNKNSFSKEANLMINNIKNSKNSVSIHVRRGDYILNPETLAYHGVCELGYYLNAIKLMINRLNDPVFYLFTDDHSNAKTMFDGIKNIVFVPTMPNDYEELLLMSYCKHNVIANSSFSWWGAWLNNNETKIVIAPKTWFANIEMQNQISDLIPNSWVTI